MTRALVLGSMFVGTCAAAGIAGTYSGHYQCAVSRTLELQVNDLGGGRISAVFRFSGSVSGAYSMSGFYDARSGRFRLQPQQWITHPQGFDMIGLEGVFDANTRRLSGRIPIFGCTTFELGPPGLVYSAPSSQIPPLPVNPNDPAAVFDYWDATMDTHGRARESEPIDDVIDWLRKQGFSCMGSTHVVWDRSGTQGSARDAVSVRERYVVECDGDCRGLRYTPYVDARISSFGKAQPAPVFEIRSFRLGGSGFRWEFRRMPNGPPPDVYIHRWTSSGFNSGGDCRAPKAFNH